MMLTDGTEEMNHISQICNEYGGIVFLGKQGNKFVFENKCFAPKNKEHFVFEKQRLLDKIFNSGGFYYCDTLVDVKNCTDFEYVMLFQDREYWDKTKYPYYFSGRETDKTYVEENTIRQSSSNNQHNQEYKKLYGGSYHIILRIGEFDKEQERKLQEEQKIAQENKRKNDLIENMNQRIFRCEDLITVMVDYITDLQEKVNGKKKESNSEEGL